MEKSFFVYFKDKGNVVYMAQDFEKHKAFATLNINEASEFSSIEIAQQFIDLLKSKSTNCPELHIIDFISL